MGQYIITTGDAEGIGLEVTLKALQQVCLRSRDHFTYFRGKKISTKLRKRESLLLRNHKDKISLINLTLVVYDGDLSPQIKFSLLFLFKS